MQLGTSLGLYTLIDRQQERYPSSQGILQGVTSTLKNCFQLY